ncbi:multicomponent K+:H+ antiporter subunit F [Xanthobacter sp. SG618]|uniref:K+/H+ antiporter subunit F n=1 Tax=Xanthobacter sp. SG618 TaxID=2587121 RepID=UPI00145D5FBA|nr:K+/H+ antiporter subunit F [Xanthobacter sp. SG618]NMN58937.1 multicomponent K+:H+ antiporter subunit F [Xanthobacter sp. SG618]
MITIAIAIATGAICVALGLTLYRLVIGPDATDRVLALDTLVIEAIALIVLIGIAYGTGMYFEAALLFAMVGFVTTVAFCKFLLRGNVIE